HSGEVRASPEAIAVSRGRTSVDEGQHGQVLGAELARWIKQHAFYGAAVIGLPLVAGALRQCALGKQLVECRNRPRLSEPGEAVSNVNLGRLIECRIAECDLGRVLRHRVIVVAAVEAIDYSKFARSAASGVALNFCAASA